MKNTTVERLIIAELNVTLKRAIGKTRGINQAASVLQQNGVEVDWNKVADACDPWDGVVDYFRRVLDKIEGAALI